MQNKHKNKAETVSDGLPRVLYLFSTLVHKYTKQGQQAQKPEQNTDLILTIKHHGDHLECYRSSLCIQPLWLYKQCTQHFEYSEQRDL